MSEKITAMIAAINIPIITQYNIIPITSSEGILLYFQNEGKRKTKKIYLVRSTLLRKRNPRTAFCNFLIICFQIFHLFCNMRHIHPFHKNLNCFFSFFRQFFASFFCRN